MKSAIAFAVSAGFLFAPAAMADPAFKSLSYDVTIVPDFAAGTITGAERLRFRSLSDNLDTLSFTSNALTVSAFLNVEAGVTTSTEGGRRIFHLPCRLSKGEEATLTMTFAGRPERDVVFIPNEIHTGYFTCEVMVCDIDRPDDRASLLFSLVLPNGMDAVAPGELVRRDEIGDDRVDWTWQEDRPYPAYLYGFAAGRYARAPLAQNPPLSVLYTGETPERMQTMFADTARMIAFYETKAGVKLPERHYTQVLVDRNGDQEDASLSMIEKKSVEPILTDPHDDGMIAHELAHQWWGNLVTCADWKELWLNEGMAGFMTAAYKEQRWGRADYDREIAVAQKAWDAAKKAGLDEPLSWAGTYTSLRDKRRIAYGKSMVFLDTLRSQLGEDAFWRGVQHYTQENAGRSVTAADLQKAFEAASGRDLSALFKTWVYENAPARAAE